MKLIYIILIILFIIFIYYNNIEEWRELNFEGNNSILTYNNLNNNNRSKYIYPIDSPISDNYDSYLNNITSTKFSYIRTGLNDVKKIINQNNQEIIFNKNNLPIELKINNENKIKKLVDILKNILNKVSDYIFRIEFIKTFNEKYEETENQYRISFNLFINIIFADKEYNNNENKFVINTEFIFTKINDNLTEDVFFTQKNNNFISYLTLFELDNNENYGFLLGNEN